MDQLEETEESSKEKNLFFLDESQYISKEEKKQAVKKERQKFKILERRMDKEESKGKEEIMTARTKVTEWLASEKKVFLLVVIETEKRVDT